MVKYVVSWVSVRSLSQSWEVGYRVGRRKRTTDLGSNGFVTDLGLMSVIRTDPFLPKRVQSLLSYKNPLLPKSAVVFHAPFRLQLVKFVL